MNSITNRTIPRTTLGLVLSVVMSMALLSTFLLTGDAGRVQAQTTGDCLNGVAVSDPSANPGLVSDCEVLLAAQNTLAGTASLNWSASLPISRWDGVELSESLNRVAALGLRGHRLTGKIPAEFGKLSELRELTLSAYLCDDSGCTLETGSESNRLTGEIPSELGNLNALTYLDLGGNQLSGRIPSELGNLTNLELLWSHGNNLGGEIPAELGDLSNLESLALGFNQLSGEIPSELGNLTSLEDLWLDDNQLNGEIPSELGSLSALTTLDLDDNQLGGEIPAELGNLNALTHLDLSGNQLSGEIPSELGRLSNLTFLFLGNNQLAEGIPSELGDLTNLEFLWSHGNNLSGEIPAELGDLSNLVSLALGFNQLSGEIPSELGNLTSLEDLWLDDNQLSGEIPSELGNLTNLVWLSVNSNRLGGEIPSELGNLSSLERLNLSDNQLSGEIPSELGNLTNLVWLRMSGNQLSGCIPSELRDVQTNDFDDLNLPFCDGTATPSPTPEPTPEGPADECVGTVSGSGAITGTWSDDCASEGRSGSYASYYTFTLTESAEVTITAESSVDTYLFLRQGSGRDGVELCDNDDYGSQVSGDQCQGIDSTLESGYDSGLVASLGPGSYTIEVTTYPAGETGTFTLAISGLPPDVAPTPTPEPTTTPTPEPTPTPTPEPADECVGVVSDNGAISGTWNSDCDSEGRSGSYASYYTFTLVESADVTITAESDVDTWLFLREGAGRVGTVLHENDDHDTTEFSLSSSLDSGISANLDAGSYTIEVTTYTAGETGTFTLTVSGLPTAITPTPTPTPSPTPEPTITITFGDLNWSSVMLQNRIAQYIAELGYGYSTSVEFGSSRPLFQALRAGNIDVLMEVWLPNQEEDLEEALTEGSVSSPGSSLGSDWQSAFVIPKYLQEQYPDLDSVEDLKEEQYRTLFATDETDGKARLVSCPVGWNCAGVNAKQVEGYGLSDHVHIVNPASAVALDADITEAYENEEPWLGFQWGTNNTALLLDLVRLEEPPYSDECWSTTMACAYEESTILIAVNAGLSESADDFVAMLTELDFNVDGNYKPVVRWQSANPEANLEDAALWWLRENGDVWSEWVTADAGSTIQAALESGEIPDGWPQEPNITPVTTPTPEPTPTPTPEPPADECVSVVNADGAITGSWSSDCASEGRSGSYASYYTFTLVESAEVTVTAESSVDTYLLLREGSGRYGTLLHENDDHDATEFSLSSGLDSGISANLDAGSYTIEVTTYDEGETGTFTLTIGGLPAAVTPTPEPSPTPGPSPEPTPSPTPTPPSDECVSAVSGNGTIIGTWSSECDSEDRSGSYASYYIFTLSESAELTVMAESSVDTYLFLRQGSGRDGAELCNNDDYGSEVSGDQCQEIESTLESEYDSGLVASLGAGTYTIEITTYTAGETGTFTLTISGLPVAVVLGPSTDRAALVALYNATNGANWTRKANWLSDEPLGEWHGVTTDDDGRVTEVRLSENNLAGSIPSELGRLSSLTILHLADNQLIGQIPEELGSVANLEELVLGGNQLSGEIPSELGNLSNLTGLYLWGNELSGQIPEELGNLANLERVFLDGNQLMGEIPSELGSLANLERLGLGGNELSGWIPSELGSLANLQYLGLTRNQLNGEIPSELGSLADLDELALGGNKLSGEIPPDLGNLSNMTELYLWGNELSGEIPSELGNLSSVAILSLSHNKLTRSIPSELGSLSNLTELYLQENRLSGALPSELGRLSNLTVLRAYENRLSSGIPSALGRLSNLTVLHLGGNQLSGQIPEELGSLSNLTEMNLGSNELSGEIPAELGNLSDLTELHLQENRFSGAIPSELGRLTNLTVLNAWENQLNGEIPSVLGNLSDLEVLSLSRNQLTGDMPSNLGNLFNLTILDLTRNTVSGKIPDELGRLSSLEILALGGNQLSGEIPVELGNLLSLTELWAWGNDLGGEIPPELGSLSSLTVLHLINNELSGEIPDELGQLTNLELLGLGRNQLSGEIPSELGGLSNLDQLYLYDNQLNGEIPAEILAIPRLRFIALYGNQLSGIVPEHAEERNILTTIYNSTSGANWEENENWGSAEPVFAWDRVVIEASGHVTALWLNRNELSGQIPSELGSLTNLARLYFNGNQLTGEIPAELGNLEDLEELYLRDNRLSGCIPAGLQEVPRNDLYDLGLEFCSDEN